MAKKKSGVAVEPVEAAVDTPAETPAPAAPAAAPAPAGVQISEARRAQLKAMLGPDGKLLPSHEEDMRERGISADEVLAAINGTASRVI